MDPGEVGLSSYRSLTLDPGGAEKAVTGGGDDGCSRPPLDDGIYRKGGTKEGL